MKTKIISIVIGLSIQAAIGQGPMDPGFRLLENGDFDTAVSFFDTYLKKEPENKTALICYGRAVGLNGNPGKASAIFESLLDQYPGDLEVRLNLYEAYLWDKAYDQARIHYRSLVIEHPDNFVALLGYANTLSNLKEYGDALHYISRAIALQPENSGARVSKKYISMGLAAKHATEKQYEEGITLLQQLLTEFPRDREVLMSLASIQLQAGDLERAKETYQVMAVSGKDSVAAFTGIALVQHLQGEDKAALNTAVEAKTLAAALSGTPEYEIARERYLQALIWNGQYKAVRKHLDSIATNQRNDNWVLALAATLGMYTGDFRESLALYGKLLEKDSLSFDGNLGTANALFAKGDFKRAYKAAYRTLEVFPGQKDAEAFLEKLNRTFRPGVSQKAGYSFDNGNNTAFIQGTSLRVPISTDFTGTLSHEFRSTENTLSGAAANSNIFLAGVAYQLLPGVSVNANFGVNKSEAGAGSYTLPIGGLKLQLMPFKLQNLELGYNRELQNFNADLISREILMNHYSLNYNLGTNRNLGWYTQLMHTRQTDGNNRNLVFSSLYYMLLKKPALKMGFNYQYLGFSSQLPEVYFSPERFHAYEVFADSRGNLGKKLKYVLGAASGFQKVEQTDYSPIFRAEFSLKHNITGRFDLGIYGRYSNIASAVASGFEFTELGINLQWALSKTPVFKTQP